MNFNFVQFALALRDIFYRSRRRLATAGVFLLALWVAFHVVFGPNGMMVYQRKRAEYRAVQKEIESLQQENQRLQQQIKGLKTDPKVIEREAREQLRYARPGETVYILPAPRPAAPPATAQK